MNTQNTDTLQTPEFAAYVGLDWGDKKHALAWTAGPGKTAPQTGSLVNSPEVLHAWLQELGQRFGHRKVVLAIEACQSALLPIFVQYGFLELYLINPKSLAYLEGTELDFVRDGLNEGFKFNNPNVKNTCGCGSSFSV